MIRPTLLPPEVEQALSALGQRLQARESVGAEASVAVAGLSALPATAISQAARAIRNIATLYPRCPPPITLEALFRRGLWDREQMLRLPDLAYIYLFHADGHLRQAALQRITSGLPSPFLFAAVAFRLNDWAAPVRAAALACARRCLPLTRPEVIAAAAEALLLRQDSWGRWDKEREAIDAAFDRPDVAERLAALIGRARTGPAARMLRSALRRDAMDRHLPKLAAEAAQPSVRALAVEALATGKASWVAGAEWKWIDKSMGRRLRVASHASRPLSVTVDAVAAIRSAALDRSAAVRRSALAALIADHLDSEQAQAIAAGLRADTSPSVRAKAEFILSRRGQT